MHHQNACFLCWKAYFVTTAYFLQMAGMNFGKIALQFFYSENWSPLFSNSLCPFAHAILRTGNVHVLQYNAAHLAICRQQKSRAAWQHAQGADERPHFGRNWRSSSCPKIELRLFQTLSAHFIIPTVALSGLLIAQLRTKLLQCMQELKYLFAFIVPIFQCTFYIVASNFGGNFEWSKINYWNMPASTGRSSHQEVYLTWFNNVVNKIENIIEKAVTELKNDQFKHPSKSAVLYFKNALIALQT